MYVFVWNVIDTSPSSSQVFTSSITDNAQIRVSLLPNPPEILKTTKIRHLSYPRNSILPPSRTHHHRRRICLFKRTSLPTPRPGLIKVSQSAIRKGKSTSFDGTDEEWQQILLDALFGLEQNDVQLSAQMTKKQDKLTVLKHKERLDSRLMFNEVWMMRNSRFFSCSQRGTDERFD